MIKNVLNHGYVRLVDHMGDDLSAVRSARVSYDADWREATKESDTNLLRYLVRNNHTSPLESIVFTFEVKAPIFVIRQWHRHRTWAYNEVSARYTKLDEEFYEPELDDITTQHKDNKQMRSDEVNENASNIIQIVDEVGSGAFNAYQEMIELQCPRELARSVLPVGTYSRFFATVNLHNLFHFIKLRLHPHAQKEIQVYAKAMLDLIEPIVPILSKAFLDYKLNSVTFSAKELDMIKAVFYENKILISDLEKYSNLSKSELREFKDKWLPHQSQK